MKNLLREASPRKASVVAILSGLFLSVAVLAASVSAAYAARSAEASEGFWSADTYDRFYSHCITTLMRTEVRLYPDSVHHAYCDCQVAEAEKWLHGIDMTFIVAVINGASDAELEARVEALPQSAAKPSEKRMRQYTLASQSVCATALRMAVAKILNAK